MLMTYDWVEWRFLQDIMTKLGFDERRVNLIVMCIRLVIYTVLHNGIELV